MSPNPLKAPAAIFLRRFRLPAHDGAGANGTIELEGLVMAAPAGTIFD
jgi:hypothetical protein